MKLCPYCGFRNHDEANECRDCGRSFITYKATLYRASKSYWIGPRKAKQIRDQALSAIVLGLLIKVYWGGYGP